MEINISEISLRTLTEREEIEDAQVALSRSHYLGDVKPQYRRIYQVAEYKKEWLGVLLWDQCGKRNRVRDEYIGWDKETKQIHCTKVVNNKRFCIGEKYKGIANLGSRILGLAVKDLPKSWKKKYKEEVLLCETYVDPEYHEGTSYIAAGWKDIGLSSGYETRDKESGKYVKTNPKKVFMKPLNERWQEHLNLPYKHPINITEQDPKKIPEIDFSNLDLVRLKEELCKIPDWRQSSGKRYSKESLITSITLAKFVGCKSYQSIWEWISNLVPDFKIALGFVRGTPAEITIRRFLQKLDIEELNKVIYGWLSQQVNGLDQKVIALDGKVIRGTKTHDAPATELLSAVVSPIGVTIAQAKVSDKTNEIPVAQKMLEAMPIEGKVIVADALHTQTKTAEIIVKKKPTFSSALKRIKAIY